MQPSRRGAGLVLLANLTVLVSAAYEYANGTTGLPLARSMAISFVSLNVVVWLVRRFGKEVFPGSLEDQIPGWLAIMLAGLAIYFVMPNHEARWKQHIQKAEAALQQRKPGRAEEEFNAALTEAFKVRGGGKLVIFTLDQQARLYLAEQKYPQAEVAYRQVAELQQKTNDPAAAGTLGNLAVVYMAEGKPERAEVPLKNALAWREKTAGAESQETARALLQLGEYYRAVKNPDLASDYYQRALAIQEKKPDQGPIDRVRTLMGMASLALEQNDLPRAETLARQAVDARMKVETFEAPDTPVVLALLSNVYAFQRKRDEAAATLLQALGFYQRGFQARSLQATAVVSALAGIRGAQQRWYEAEDLYEYALGVESVQLGRTHPQTNQTLLHVIRVMAAQGNLSGADLLLQSAILSSTKLAGEKSPQAQAWKQAYEEFLKQYPQFRREPAGKAGTKGR